MCLGKSDAIAMPNAVQQAIGKKFLLRTSSLYAVPACEANWAADAGKDLVAGRWGGSGPSKDFAIKAGITGRLLPVTREGGV